MNSSSNNTNGLCKSCNLNQELKISQLAKCPHEGAQLEEYRDHLEQVYRLCPLCEDHLASRLAEQDRSLAGKLLEWRLENSRLNSSRDHGNGAMPRQRYIYLRGTTDQSLNFLNVESESASTPYSFSVLFRYTDEHQTLKNVSPATLFWGEISRKCWILFPLYAFLFIICCLELFPFNI